MSLENSASHSIVQVGFRPTTRVKQVPETSGAGGVPPAILSRDPTLTLMLSCLLPPMVACSMSIHGFLAEVNAGKLLAAPLVL